MSTTTLPTLDRSHTSRLPVIVTARDNGEIAIHQLRYDLPVTVVIGPEQWPRFVEQLNAAQKKAVEVLR